METIDERFQKTIGQRVEVTFRDKQMINEAYCNGKIHSPLQIATFSF